MRKNIKSLIIRRRKCADAILEFGISDTQESLLVKQNQYTIVMKKRKYFGNHIGHVVERNGCLKDV